MSVVGVTMGSKYTINRCFNVGFGGAPTTSVRLPVLGGWKPRFWRHANFS